MNPIDIPLAILALAFAIALSRLRSGPTAADRVVAAELLFALVLTSTVLLAARLGSHHVLDVAVIVALVQFVTTAALASLVGRKPEREP